MNPNPVWRPSNRANDYLQVHNLYVKNILPGKHSDLVHYHDRYFKYYADDHPQNTLSEIASSVELCLILN